MLLRAFGQEKIATTMSWGFSGGVYGIYLLAGYLVKKRFFRRLPALAVVLIGCSSFIITVSVQFYAYAHSIKYNVWYDFLFLFLAGLCLFELLSRLSRYEKFHACGAVSFLSRYSFGVFLIHNMVRALAAPLLATYVPAGRILKLLLLQWAMLGASYVTAIILARIPRIGPWMIYLK